VNHVSIRGWSLQTNTLGEKAFVMSQIVNSRKWFFIWKSNIRGYLSTESDLSTNLLMIHCIFLLVQLPPLKSI
jgi:hypothetical protein